MTAKARIMACPRCIGTGALRVSEPECNGGALSAPCERCRGSGRISLVEEAPPECPTCAGSGEIDEGAGGIATSGVVRCPDCHNNFGDE